MNTSLITQPLEYCQISLASDAYTYVYAVSKRKCCNESGIDSLGFPGLASWKNYIPAKRGSSPNPLILEWHPVPLSHATTQVLERPTSVTSTCHAGLKLLSNKRRPDNICRAILGCRNLSIPRSIIPSLRMVQCNKTQCRESLLR